MQVLFVFSLILRTDRPTDLRTETVLEVLADLKRFTISTISSFVTMDGQLMFLIDASKFSEALNLSRSM